jgi:hypothetical protein
MLLDALQQNAEALASRGNISCSTGTTTLQAETLTRQKPSALESAEEASWCAALKKLPESERLSDGHSGPSVAA